MTAPFSQNSLAVILFLHSSIVGDLSSPQPQSSPQPFSCFATTSIRPPIREHILETVGWVCLQLRINSPPRTKQRVHSLCCRPQARSVPRWWKRFERDGRGNASLLVRRVYGRKRICRPSTHKSGPTPPQPMLLKETRNIEAGRPGAETSAGVAKLYNAVDSATIRTRRHQADARGRGPECPGLLSPTRRVHQGIGRTSHYPLRRQDTRLWHGTQIMPHGQPLEDRLTVIGGSAHLENHKNGNKNAVLHHYTPRA
jgi:hypothetical protein